MWQRLGQHFLHDQMIVEQITEEIFELQQKLNISTCLEIWPGRAVLTSHLIDRFHQLILLEIDEKLRSHLEPFEKHGKANIIRGDVLQHNRTVTDAKKGIVSLPKIDWKPASEGDDFVFQPAKTLVVGNLPYYITSPILRKFFVDPTLAEESALSFIGWVFLIQKEVAEKISSNATKKSYLRRLLNCNYHIDYCFTVGAVFFTPPPKVNSAVIRLERTATKLTHEQFCKMLCFLDIVSPYKRKTLGKIAKMEEEVLASNNFQIIQEISSKRLEDISWDEMKAILG